MHKKSIEAADALKSSDENTSDKEDTKTEASDTSSSINLRRTPTTPTTTGTTNSSNKMKQSANGTPRRTPSPAKSSSISPSTLSPPLAHHHHIQHQPHQTQQSTPHSSENSDTKGKEYCVLTNPPPARPLLNPQQGSFHHLNHHDPHASGPPMSHHHPHHHPLNPLNHSPDTDPEVFRWVSNYRDPVSYIR